MSWIKVEHGTPDKPEIYAIAEELGVDPDAAFGKVFRVWIWFDIHTEDGNAPSVTKKLLDRATGVTGFCEVMISVGWMKEENGFISLPNFDRHNGETAKKRALAAKRAEKHRQKNNAQSVTGSNAEGVTSASPEKKRKEKNNKLPNGNSCHRKFFSDDDMKSAKEIFSKIKELNPKQKEPNFESWADTIRLMRERDKRTHAEILELFTWANNDNFWRTNILSPAKLRKQWDKLEIKKNNPGSSGNRQPAQENHLPTYGPDCGDAYR